MYHGMAVCAQGLHFSNRVRAVLANRQRTTRVEFGLLLRDLRLAAGLNLRDLAGLAGVDHKTILNIEYAYFPPSLRVLQSVIAVRELYLTWADVGPALLEKNVMDGRKTRKPRKRRRRLRPSQIHSGSRGDAKDAGV